MKYSQNQKISFDNGVIKGTGKIVGVALNEQPLIGATYIIEPDQSVESSSYPYTHFVCVELHLKDLIIEDEKAYVSTDRKDSPHHYDNRHD